MKNLCSKNLKNQSGFTPHLNAEGIKIAKGNRHLSAGFTLMEVLVTIMIFSVILIIVVSIFVRAVAIERKVVAAQRIQENATLIMESIAKEVRVSKIEDEDSLDCSATELIMILPTGQTIKYLLTGDGDIERQVIVGGIPTSRDIINSSDVKITRMNFCVTGSATLDQQTPKVTILVSMKSARGETANADLETTVASRVINSELSP